MANEITAKVSLSHAQGGVTQSVTKQATQFDMTGTDSIDGIQEIATSETVVSKGAITNEGWFYLENLDGTNFVTFRQGAVADYPNGFLKLEPGEFAIGRFDSAGTLYATADTAAVKIRAYLIED